MEVSRQYLNELNSNKKESGSIEKRYVHKNGRLIWANVTPTAIRDKDGTVKYYITLIEDITDKKRLEEEARLFQAKMIHTNKMTSLGTIVSGVAHEINNPNSFIMSNAYLLNDIWKDAFSILAVHHQNEGDFLLGGIQFSELKDVMPKLLEGITEGTERIRNIIDGLKKFARSEPSDIYEKADMNQVIKNAVNILTPHIKKCTTNFHMICKEDIPQVRGNVQQLEQVVINLIMNALQALPERENNVWVSTEHDRRAGCVMVKISDEGVGISADIIDRITEPFFTTKIETGGTGLGLSISYAIVNEHRGSLDFRSKPGKGTTATVRLPVYEE